MENFWVQAIFSILSGLIIVTPLVIKLIEFVTANTKEKNWNQMLKLVMDLMADAEKQFDKGSKKKEWVLGQLRVMADTLNYDIDWAVVSEMIDKICDVSKELSK